jgi:hypothetical protein
MGTYYLADHHNSILRNDADTSNVGTENTPLAGHAKATPLILCTQVNYSNAGTCNKASAVTGLKLQVDKDGGGYGDVVAGSGEVRAYDSAGLTEGNPGTDRCAGTPAGCANTAVGVIQCTDGAITGSACAKEEWTAVLWGLDFTNATDGSTYTFQVYDTTNTQALAGSIAVTITLAAGPITLVHTDAGEDYLTHAISDPLWWVSESYNYLDDNDGSSITIQHIFPPITLVHTDAGEDYHLLVTDDPLWWVQEAYHLHAVDPVSLDLWIATAEAYHLLVTDDPLWWVSEAYHLVVTSDPLWWVQGAYHTHDIEGPIVVQEIIPPTDLVISPVGGNDLDVIDNDELDIEIFSISGAIHDHIVDSVLTETLAWSAAVWEPGSGLSYFSMYEYFMTRTHIEPLSTAGTEVKIVCQGYNHTFGNDIRRLGLGRRLGDTHEFLEPATEFTFDAGSYTKQWDSGEVETDWMSMDVRQGEELLLHHQGGPNATLSLRSGCAQQDRSRTIYSNSGGQQIRTNERIGHWPEWTDTSWENMHQFGGLDSYHRSKCPGGGFAKNYIWCVEEIWVRGAKPAETQTLNVESAAHYHEGEFVRLKGRWRTDFHEFAKGVGGSASWSYPQSVFTPQGSSLQADAIDAFGDGQQSMLAWKQGYYSLNYWRFLYPYKFNCDFRVKDSEHLVKVMTPFNFDGIIAVLLRHQPETFNQNFYDNESYWFRLLMGQDRVRITHYDGSWNTLIQTDFTLTPSTWYWMRCRAEGTALKMRVWEHGDPEPGAWTLETTDSTLTEGYSGVFCANDNSYTDSSYYVDYMEIATGGLSAQGVMAINRCQHVHVCDEIDLSVTAWSGTVPSEGVSAAAKNYRMIVEAADFDYGDSDGFIRLKLEAPPTEGITVNGASIGRRATGGELFDYDSTAVLHVRFTFDGGSDSKAIAAGQTAWSDWVPFAVDDTLDHLIHIFVSAAHKFPYNTTDWCYKSTSGNDQTMTADVKNYALVNEFLFLVRMEVRARTVLPGDLNCYHDVDDNDALDIEIFSIAGAIHAHVAQDPLWWVNEAYHLHAVDQCQPVTQLPVQEAYHLLVTSDPLWWVQEAYHLHVIDTADVFSVEGAYHLHLVGGLVLDIGALGVEEAYHLIVDRQPLWWVDESAHVTADDGPIALILYDRWADSYQVGPGSLGDGALSDTKQDNGVHMRIDEATGDPGFRVDFTFDDIPTSLSELWVNLNGRYVGNPSHIVKVQAYNYIVPGWDDLTAATRDMESVGDDDYDYTWELNVANYVSGKTAQVRFLHDWTGTPLHYLYIDELYLLETGVSHIFPEDAFHLNVPQDPLWWVQEAYHSVASRDPLWWVDEAYHTVATSDPLWWVDEMYHAIATSDPLWWVQEAYHVLADDGLYVFSVHESYHSHAVDSISLSGALTIAEAYHLVVSVDPLWWVAEAYHVLTDDGLYVFSVGESYHVHAVDAIPAFGITLAVAEASHAVVSDNLTLALQVNEANHDLVDDGPLDLSQTLTITGDALVHVADSLVGLDITITAVEAYHLVRVDHIDRLIPESFLVVVEPTTMRSETTVRLLTSLTTPRRIYS